MSWEKINDGGSGSIVKLGDKEGQVREVTGVWVGVHDGQYGPLYEIQQKGGQHVKLGGNAAIDRGLDPTKYLGKLVRLEFHGIKPMKGGKTYKDISISAYGGPYTKELLADYPALVAEGDDSFAEIPAALKGDDSLPFD